MMSQRNQTYAVVVFGVVVAAFLAAIYFWDNVVNRHNNPTTVAQIPYTSFISLCSGLDVSDQDVAMLGAANCLGRVRGIAEGHTLTVGLQPPSSTNQPMWCISHTTTDRQLVDAVIKWSVNNSQAYVNYVNQLSEDDAGTAIIVRALRETYSCKGTV